MNAKQFLDAYGKEEAERVALAAKSNYAYFSQLAYGHRRPSVRLAERLVEASDDRLDFVSLLKGREKSA